MNERRVFGILKLDLRTNTFSQYQNLSTPSKLCFVRAQFVRDQLLAVQSESFHSRVLIVYKRWFHLGREVGWSRVIQDTLRRKSLETGVWQYFHSKRHCSDDLLSKYIGLLVLSFGMVQRVSVGEG